jgi:TPR repeat protein
MYADDDGVVQDDLRAFEYFRRIADTHAEDSPSAPQAAIVANWLVPRALADADRLLSPPETVIWIGVDRVTANQVYFAASNM